MKNKQTFVVQREAGGDGSIFGSVSERNVVEAIEESLGESLNSAKVVLPEIHEVGECEVRGRFFFFFFFFFRGDGRTLGFWILEFFFFHFVVTDWIDG